MEVPTNASRILFSPNDSFFEDNADMDSDFISNIHIIREMNADIRYAVPMQVVFAPQLNAGHYYEWPYDLVANKAQFSENFTKYGKHLTFAFTEI